MKKVALFFGGLSNEAEVSIISATRVADNFDYKKYELILIYWAKDGLFYKVKNFKNLKNDKKNLVRVEDFKKSFDIALLMTHGRYGEDGVLQSILEVQMVKYCGCRPLASALCMDKVIFKNFLLNQKIDQTKFLSLDAKLMEKPEFLGIIEKIKKDFKLPFYVKPANSGSSVGISKVEKMINLEKAIKEALKHDQKIIVEEGLINPKELEVAVLGNSNLIVSSPGELKLVKDFYSYDDKYKAGEAKVVIPAEISKQQIETIKTIAQKVYKLCGCSGFARVDFFLHNNKIYLNEINTLPGFTDISMFPMLMASCCLSYKKLINKIIELAY
jgi:D-alanine-D-alanine ligase